MKTLICIFMAALLSNIPHVAAAEVAGQMIPTAVIVDEMTRAQSEAKIREIVSRSDVQEQLLKLGISKDEVSKRLASLSDQEVQQMAKQMDEARYGSDVVIGLLVIVVLVLLIIFLAKRV